MGGLRPSACLVLVVFLAAALSGCVATKSETRDQVLTSWSREKPSDTQSEVKISVPKDTERIKFSVSTKPPKKEGGTGWDWGSWQPCYYPPCETDETSSTPSGHVSVTLWDPQNNEQGNIKLNYDSAESFVLHDPLPGTWNAKISYFSYDGPVALSATEPVQTGGGIGGSFWDILGVILAVTTIVGGWFLYRRRGQFLSREMHRIDHTYRDRSADVDECRTNLLEMKDHLSGLLMRRKIEESQYLILEKRIDQYLKDLETPGNRHDEAQPQKTTAVDRFRRTGG